MTSYTIESTTEWLTVYANDPRLVNFETCEDGEYRVEVVTADPALDNSLSVAIKVTAPSSEGLVLDRVNKWFLAPKGSEVSATLTSRHQCFVYLSLVKRDAVAGV